MQTNPVPVPVSGAEDFDRSKDMLELSYSLSSAGSSFGGAHGVNINRDFQKRYANRFFLKTFVLVNFLTLCVLAPFSAIFTAV